MLSSLRQRKHHGLASLPPPSRFLILLFILVTQSLAAAGTGLRNFTIPVTSPQIVYTPFVCNSTTVAANPQLCTGAWQLSDPSSSNPSIIAVSIGPFNANRSANLIPQLFFQFRASALFVSTLPSSNATANIGIVSNGTSISTRFNSALGAATIINLPENDTSVFTITLVPSTSSTWFALQSITLTALADIPVTSLFPTASLPSSTPLATLTLPTSTSASALPVSTSAVPSNLSSSSNRKKIAEAVGITLGLGLGLTAVAVILFWYWSRRRRRRRGY